MIDVESFDHQRRGPSPSGRPARTAAGATSATRLVEQTLSSGWQPPEFPRSTTNVSLQFLPRGWPVDDRLSERGEPADDLPPEVLKVSIPKRQRDETLAIRN